VRLKWPTPKRRNKSQYLTKKYGGRWEYDGHTTWHCNDGRYVMRCSAGVDEFDNDLGSQYWLYEEGKAPELVLF